MEENSEESRAYIFRAHPRISPIPFQKMVWRFPTVLLLSASSKSATDAFSVTTIRDASLSIESYVHKNFNVTYLNKPAAPRRENEPSIVLVHPVGIGLSSWFWTKMMEEYTDNPGIFAPDLLGCGLDHGASAWNPDEQGLFFPLSWTEGIETLLNDKVGEEGCTVVVQGGLAPVGILLASRNPQKVKRLILTSPPTHEDIVNAVNEDELKRNYDILRSNVPGSFAFRLLEMRSLIKLFSDLFLFEDGCDDRWLDETQRENRPEARTPVQAFNAGLLQHRSYLDELREIAQPVFIVSGNSDKRAANREGFRADSKFRL